MANEIDLYSDLKELEKELKLHFNPEVIKNIEQEIKDIEQKIIEQYPDLALKKASQ